MQETLSLQRKAGGFLGAKRFVPVSNMRMMGGIDVMGSAGKSFFQKAGWRTLHRRHRACRSR
ncbi:MAG: hypothetical protein KF834_03905 [Burkholderiales bacterium]|nr:hypothetical protein [Burkholderiales bacterium]